MKKAEALRNMKKIVDYLRKSYIDYMHKSNLKRAVIGLSGGIDSALVAALAQSSDVFLIGISLPSRSNKPDELIRAKKCSVFCDSFFVKDIDFDADRIAANTGTFHDHDNMEDKIRFGNIKARTRMIYLYDFAQKHQGLVLGTDNLTEYNLGFWTLHGDVGDLSLIQNLWKTEVYAIAEYLVHHELTGQKREALQLCIDAIPTDGLGITNSDLEAIGVKSYDAVDFILQNWIFKKIGNKNNPVIQRHLRTAFKRHNPMNIRRLK